MDRFVRLLIFDSDGTKVWRTVNLHYVRHFDEDTCRVMFNGAKTPITVDKDSMPTLVEAATTDMSAISARMSYLQAKSDCKTLPVNATLVLSERAEGRLSNAILSLCGILCRPWWKKLFGRV